MKKNKKIFPKIKKKLKNFLADESGKITKKDALGLAAGAILLSGGEDVIAGHTNTCVGSGHVSGYSAGGHANGYRDGGTINVTKTAHGSGLVNGHYSGTPSGGHANGIVKGTRINGTFIAEKIDGFLTTQHGNAVSHSSHGSGGWC